MTDTKLDIAERRLRIEWERTLSFMLDDEEVLVVSCRISLGCIGYFLLIILSVSAPGGRGNTGAGRKILEGY